MAQHSVKIAIIGGGSAGMRAYRAARKQTDSIALIEGGQFGTTCARVGCMPSKLLIAPAEAAHRLEVLPQFGLTPGPLTVDGPAVMKRVREERDRFVGFVQHEVTHGFDEKHIIRAYATFKNDTTLTLSNGDELTAERIVIAVGSRPKVLPQFEPAAERVVTSDDVFYWQDLPESVAVFGSGVVGLELGQALHRLGVRVRIFARSERLGGLTDPKVSTYARETLKKELPYSVNVALKEVCTTPEGVTIRFAEGVGPTQEEAFDYLLSAVGRESNAKYLGLEQTSLKLDERGLPIYDAHTMQCGESSIFIAGDALGDLTLLHEAADEGLIAGENAGRFPDVVKRPRKTSLAVVFTDPQIATVGQSYQQLVDQGIDFKVASADFEDQGRSRVMLVNKGLMRLYADSTNRKLLGAEMIGPGHEHLAHLLAWSIQLGLTVDQMLTLPFYHPVVEEGLRDGLYALRAELGKLP